MARKARLFVLSGPSGAGKGTILRKVREARPELGLTVSATTRAPREGEVDGTDYYFMTEERFSQLIDEGAFLEWAHVHGHRYGTLNSEVDRLMAQGSSVILEIDVQGAFAVQKQRPDAILLFVAPPSPKVLEQRLRNRGTEDEEHLALRLANARRELELADRYDECVVNDKLDLAVSRALALIDQYEYDGGAD